MRAHVVSMVSAGIVAAGVAVLVAQQGAGAGAGAQTAAADAQAAPRAGNGQRPDDEIKQMVGRLNLEKFKTTLTGLTQFGDRREGTQRNRDAVAWIEAQLRSYGCAEIGRLTYEVPARGAGGGGGGGNRGAAAGGAAGAAGAGAGAAAGGGAAGGAAGGGAAGAARAGAAGAGAAGAGAAGAGAAAGGAQAGGGRRGAPQGSPNGNAGGSMSFGLRAPTGVNNDPLRQPDEKLRALNQGPVLPDPIPEVYCTKIGTTHPEEMYIIGGHMDGIGFGAAVNDDGSGTTLVMEVARVLSSPDIQTERSVRFALWNGEEGGLRGATAYVNQRKALQGIENPAGSRKYPEPKWLGMMQHDMMMWDHGMPVAQLNPDGTPKLDANGQPTYYAPKDQRPEADVNIEFQSVSKFAEESMKFAFFVKSANERYATDYPANVGPHMTNTDSGPFMDLCPAISLRENERGAQTGAGWNPTWHQPIDVMSTFSDKDFKLGLNATQTTLAAIAELVGAKIKK